MQSYLIEFRKDIYNWYEQRVDDWKQCGDKQNSADKRTNASFRLVGGAFVTLGTVTILATVLSPTSNALLKILTGLALCILGDDFIQRNRDDTWAKIKKTKTIISTEIWNSIQRSELYKKIRTTIKTSLFG